MILTLTANPSHDRTITLTEALRRGAVQRADSVTSQPGGKGVNISRACVAASIPTLAVLPAPKDPTDADRIHPTDVTKVIEAARRRWDYVVVDTPAQLSEVVLAAFDLSNSLYVMATMDLPSVRNMGVFLNTLDKLKIPSDNINLILNKAEKDVGIDVEQITKLFPQGFQAVLPYAREVSKSVNVGTPILAFAPASETSTRIDSSPTSGGSASVSIGTTYSRIAPRRPSHSV